MIFPGIGTFVNQLRGAGIETPVLGPLTLQTRELLNLLGPDASNVFYSTQFYWEAGADDEATAPEIVEFTELYEEMFDTYPEQANGPGSYQVFNAVIDALRQDGVTDARSAADAIRAQVNHEVPGGTLLRWQDGYAVWNPVISSVQDGEFALVTTYEASLWRE
jgi:branched-chain amino acid transport system substrate-binding protein